MRDYIADPELPIITEEGVLLNPTVRIEYEQAIAFGGIGETIYATRNKHWGDGPWIMPLKVDDMFYAERITYRYRQNSLYNRRFEQRQRMKELLGRRYRPLVEIAKYKRHTRAMFLETLTPDQARAVERRLNVDPITFWRMCRGKTFVELPPREVQLELPFGEDDL